MKLAFWRRNVDPIVFPHEVIHPGGDDRYLNRTQLEQATYWLAHIAGAAIEEVHEADHRESVRVQLTPVDAATTQMRLEDALLAKFSEVNDLQKANAELEHERDELLGALDERRPAPDRYELGLVLEQQWHRWATQERTTPEAWACVADHAIDFIRGLWPNTPPTKPLPPGVEGLIDNEANRLLAETVYEMLAPKTSSGGGEAATAGVSTAANATGTLTPDDPTREAEADRVRDELGAIIAARDVEYAGGSWEGMHPGLRAYYLDRADAVINAGWRPPLPEVAR